MIGKMNAEEIKKEAGNDWQQEVISVDENETDYSEHEISYNKGYISGFQDGYIARANWHDLRNNPRVLPKEKKLYLVAIKNNGLAIAYFTGLHWETKYNMGDFGHLVETVIAWCEIPQFKEAE